MLNALNKTLRERYAQMQKGNTPKIEHKLEMDRRRIRQLERVATVPFVDRNKYVPAGEKRNVGPGTLA